MEDLSFYNREDSMLRKAQFRMLEILDVFVDICEKHRIDYWLHAGTALGAYRHKGFIPWDDDLDVAVLKKDYKKLCTILEKELPVNLKLQTRKTDKNFRFFYAKIRDLNSIFYENIGEEYKFRGIFIDIFPLVNVPSRLLKKILDSILQSPYSYARSNVLIKKIRYLIMMMLIPLANLTVAISSVFINNSKSGFLLYNYGIRTRHGFQLSCFYPIAKITFEGKKYNVPGDIEGYLSDHFGNDYMTIPPKDKRRMHANSIAIFK